MLKHGESPTVEIETLLPVWLSDDPELSLVLADLSAWMDAHPCECEALCECGDEDEA